MKSILSPMICAIVFAGSTATSALVLTTPEKPASAEGSAKSDAKTDVNQFSFPVYSAGKKTGSCVLAIGSVLASDNAGEINLNSMRDYSVAFDKAAEYLNDTDTPHEACAALVQSVSDSIELVSSRYFED